MAINDLDQELERLQKSTKTTFGELAPLHDRLRMRFSWYYSWHANPRSSSTHFGILTAYVIFLIFGSVFTLFGGTIQRAKAETTVVDCRYVGMSDDPENWDVADNWICGPSELPEIPNNTAERIFNVIIDSNFYAFAGINLNSDKTVASVTMLEGGGNVFFVDGGHSLMVSNANGGSGAFTIAAGEIFTIQNSSTLNIQGDFSVGDTTGLTIIDNSTVNFSGGAQNIIFDANGMSSAGNITFSGSGTKLVSGSISTGNNISVEGTAALDLATNDLEVYIGGNLTIANGATWTKQDNGVAKTNLTTDTASASITDNSAVKQDLGILNIASGSTTTITAQTDIKVSSVTVAAGDTFDISNRNLTLTGTGNPLAINGALTATGSTVTYSGATTATNIATLPYNNLTLTPAGGATTTYNLTGNLTDANAMTGNLTINTGATLTASASNYSIALPGNWTNNGTFTANNGTVTFEGTDPSTITGDTSFYDLVMDTNADGAKQINFTANSGQSVSNTWTLDGAPDKQLTLKSTSPGTEWYFDIATIFTSGDYITVQDSYNGTAQITPGENVTNLGNNPGWLFNEAPIISNPGPLEYIDSNSWTTNNKPGPFTFTLADVNVGQQVKYQIQIAATSSFETPVVDYTSAAIDQGQGSFTVGQAPGSGTYSSGNQDQTLSDNSYYWRARAIDAINGSLVSDWAIIGEELVVDFKTDGSAPTVNSGTDQAKNIQFTQNATASDATSGIATYAWTKQSGAGTITFGSSDAEDTTILADADGTYVIRLTVTDNAGNSAYDEMTLIWDTQEPTVSAGADQTKNNQFTQNATASDATSGIATYAWSKVSGPGTVTFGTANAEDTTIFTNSDGAYVIRLTATDNAGNSASDDFSLIWDTVDPNVTNITSTTANGSYNTDDVIVITIQFNEIVTVSGTPRLLLETGATDTYVNYSSGSNSDTLTFNYTIQSGNNSNDLDYQSVNALSLNGGSIRDSATNNAVLTLFAPGAADSLGANKQIIVDTTNPTAVTASTITPTSDTTPLWSWSASTEAGSGLAGYTIKIGSTSGASDILAETNIAVVTQWGANDDYTTPLSQGAKYFSIKSRDNAGNESAYTASSVLVDTQAPSTTTPEASSPTNNQRPTWNWSASTDSLSGIQNYYIKIGTTANADDILGETSVGNTLSYTPSSNLSPGTYYLSVKARDNVNNSSAYSSSGALIIDTSAPSGTISINSGAETTEFTSVILALSAADTGGASLASMSFSSDGASYTAWENYSNTKTYNLPEGDGNKTVSVKYKDTAGNTSAPFTDTILLDTTGPNTFSLYSPDNNSWTNQTSIHFDWEEATDLASDISKYQLYIDDILSVDNIVPSITSYDKTGFNVGTHTWQIKAFDALGKSTSSEKRTFAIDQTPPTPPLNPRITNLSNPEQNLTNQQSVILEWDGATDQGAGVKSYLVYIGTEAGKTDVLNGVEVIDTKYETSLDEDGTYFISIKTKGNASNLSVISQEIQIKVDRTAPSSISKATAFDISNKIAGIYGAFVSWTSSTDSAGDIKEYQVYQGKEKIGAVSFKTGDKESSRYFIKLDLAPGRYTYHVTPIDLAGNSGPSSPETPLEITSSNNALSITDIKSTPSTVVDPDTGKTSTLISWTTNTLATSTVDIEGKIYGEENLSKLNMGHSVLIPDLKASTSYRFTATSKDLFGNSTTSDSNTFRTNGITEKQSTLEIIIQSLRDVFNIFTKASAKLLDQFGLLKPTQISPTGIIVYNVSDPDNQVYASALVLSKANTIIEKSIDGKNFSVLATPSETYYIDESLSGDTNYFYRIQGSDSVVSLRPDGKDVEPPTILDPKIVAEATSLSDDKAMIVITWQTSRPATSQVFYGEGTPSNKTDKDDNLNTTHLVVLDDLKPGSDYKYTVSSVADNDLEAKSDELTFATPKKTEKESVLEIIVKQLQDLISKFSGWLKV